MLKLKARHWSLLAMIAAVVSITLTPDPMDALLVGAVAALFYVLQEDLDD